MSTYKLTYFDVRGFGEAARMILTYAGVPFEDVRIQMEDWPTIKPTTPNGQVPILEVDGKQLTQSGAIIRYLSRKFGLIGKDEWETAKCDELFGWYYDTVRAHNGYLLHKLGYVLGDEKELYAIYLPMVTKVMERYTETLKDSKSGFFLESGFSYADLIIHLHVNTIKNVEPELFSKFPVVVEHFERINNLPQLKAYIANRKYTVN